MKKRTLDRAQSFDQVHGDDALGRAFFQDGAYFDVNGNEVTETEPDADDSTGADKVADELAETKTALADAETKASELDGELAERNAELERVKLELASVNEEFAAYKAANPVAEKKTQAPPDEKVATPAKAPAKASKAKA